MLEPNSWNVLLRVTWLVVEPKLGSRSHNRDVLITVTSPGQVWRAKHIVNLAGEAALWLFLSQEKRVTFWYYFKGAKISGHWLIKNTTCPMPRTHLPFNNRLWQKEKRSGLMSWRLKLKSYFLSLTWSRPQFFKPKCHFQCLETNKHFNFLAFASWYQSHCPCPCDELLVSVFRSRVCYKPQGPSLWVWSFGSSRHRAHVAIAIVWFSLGIGSLSLAASEGTRSSLI